MNLSDPAAQRRKPKASVEFTTKALRTQRFTKGLIVPSFLNHILLSVSLCPLWLSGKFPYAEGIKSSSITLFSNFQIFSFSN